MKKSNRERGKFGIFIRYLLVAALFVGQISAAYAQNLTLNYQKTPLLTVLKEIQAQTQYTFVYNNSLIDVNREVSIASFNEDILVVLNKLLGNTDIDYRIVAKHISLSPKSFPQTNANQQTPQASQYGLIRVTGVVVDENNKPFPGVIIMLKNNTTVYAIADDNGRFSIENVPTNGILVVSFLGYETLEEPVNGRTSLNLSLKTPTVNMLDDVVVTGYQTIVREKATGSVTTINSNALQQRHASDIVSNLEGRVAGLVIDGDRITIRGTGSLRANSTPVIVVDGLPIEGSWRDLNPYDIESVTVLKDAAAAAMYGARASAGIIVITTKRPTEIGRISVDVQANFTISQKRNLDYADNFYMTPEQQVNAEADYYKYRYITDVDAGSSRSAFRDNTLNKNNVFSPIQYAYYRLGENLISESDVNSLLSELRKNNYAKEYSDNVLLNQFVQQYNVAIRSMTDKYQSSLVLNYKHDNAGMIEEGNSQLSIFYKGEYKIAKWISANFSVNNIIQNAHSSSYDQWLNKAKDPFSEFAYSRLLNSDGSYANNTRFGNGLFTDDPAFRPTHYNAMEEMAYDQTRLDRQSSRFNGGLVLTVLEGLTAQAQFTYESIRSNSNRLSEADSYLMRMMRNAYTRKDANNSWEYMIPETGGRLVSENYKADFWTARGQLNYSRTFADMHSIVFLTGLEFRQTRSKGSRSMFLGYDDQLQIQNTANLNFRDLRDWKINPYYYDTNTESFFGLISGGIGIDPSEQYHRFASGYANITYTYNGKYNLFGSFRKDYADVYGLNSKYRGSPLWSIGTSWLASGEEFMKNIEWINYLKARGSYGITGNIVQGVTSYMVANTSVPVNNYTQQPRAVINTPANPYLTWEKTTTTNFGIDFSLFNNRLRGSLDWYYKKANDVWALKTLEPTSGFNQMWLNMASLHNNGVEVALAYDWFHGVDRNGFTWNTSLTMAYNNNNVDYVESLDKTAGALVGNNKHMEGYPTSSMWSYRFGGLTEDGQRRYLDSNGAKLSGNEISGKDPDAVIYSGQREPKVTMGVDNTFYYRGFNLSIMAVYYGGYKMRCLQTNALSLPVGANNPGPMPSYLLRAWTPENPNTDVPGTFQNSKNLNAEGGGQYNYLDIYVQDADFIKIRNIVLGYDLPRNLTGKLGMQNINVRFQVDNLKPLWTKNSVGIDPETGGITLPTSFILGLNLSF